ncbi:hypothetical protein [Halomarina rubra]|uniref:DUF4382 domain-containing protein n=1 Tax=Halomarina rubra TaxID=2071873 RepID=A0ABD6AQ86_9EURY|nr:hypothetical protein [Halomarina rubra]
MRRTVVVVALAALVVLAGCSAIDVNRPADNASNESDAPGGPGAPTTDGSDTATTDDTDDTDDTDQAARGETETVTDDAGTAEPTATPVPETLRLTNDGGADYVVAVTVTKGPIEAVKLAKADGSTDVVVLDEQSLDDALTFDTVDVRPVEVVQANTEVEVDPGESLTTDLPGEDRRYVLVEVHVDDEERTVVGATTLSCSVGESVADVSVTVDGDDVDVTSVCAD